MKHLISLEDLGFNSWFENKLAELPESENQLARVTTVNRDGYMVRGLRNEIPAELAGKFSFTVESNLNLPTVGDWVFVQYHDDSTQAIIHDLFPRKTLLKRKVAGKRMEFQLIASNIDVGFIFQSCDFDFNVRRLERYLVMINEAGIEPVILLSKSDLVSKEELDQKLLDIKNNFDPIPAIAFSSTNGSGLNDIRQKLESNKTICLLGSSGVGKTTLLNLLLDENRFKTKTIRKSDSKGRHATSQRQLILLEGGSLIIDTPGMRELGNIDAESGLKASFTDIEDLAEQCRFRNCTHTNEADCAVLRAVEESKLDPKRHLSFLKLRREIERNERSYLEKRRKDKKFGKMVKQVKNDKKKGK
ncbi:MAG: ribosome small subunit-dependent GTPase A [Candidatus Aminicenantes bacterium]|nr:ribosome small subunit-dependent GTPase A [Candidatus Aminicenantes bacterium]